jgi:hypothetical protein
MPLSARGLASTRPEQPHPQDASPLGEYGLSVPHFVRRQTPYTGSLVAWVQLSLTLVRGAP